MELLETYNLKQIVNEPTRVTKESKTLKDHIYITNLEKLQESHVVQYSASDHYPVCMTRSVLFWSLWILLTCYCRNFV
jgi:endonuclease/exonuclease/phosphatase family metal-dependent hydrolase